MRKSFISKVVSIVLCLTVVLVLLVSPGCAKEKPAVPQNLNKLSLVEMWNMTAEATGVQEDSAELESLLLLVDEEGRVFSLSFTFQGRNQKGRPEVYFVGKNSKGELDWHAYEIDSVTVKRHPAEVFNEIDSLGLSSLELGEAGFSMMVDFISGDIGYDYQYLDIYQLEGGTLLPLNKVVFHSGAPWCTISVSEHRPPETVTTEDGQIIAQATTVAAPVPPGKRTSQIWFLSEDINRAEIVEYLDDKQKTEYDDFVSGIQGVLPEGWEMELITQEGLMVPPHGHNEPLFRIDFVDRTHQFEAPGAQMRFPSFRLYFYDVKARDAVLETIEQEKIYSWDIPEYFDETAEYIVVTSPLYINGGCFSDEAMSLYTPLEKSLKDYFNVTSD